jgi:hypothetical protein
MNVILGNQIRAIILGKLRFKRLRLTHEKGLIENADVQE